jgi:hypothetical protein
MSCNGGNFEGVADNVPGYLYSSRTRDLTSRNAGWSRLGMLKYNELCLKVKEEQVANNGRFDMDYKMHWVENMKGKRKWSSPEFDCKQ